MQATRRGFIGTVLGTLVASKVPFTATAEDRAKPIDPLFDAPWSDPNVAMFRRLWHAPREELMGCFSSLQIDDGTWVRGGPMVGVDRTVGYSLAPRAEIRWATDRIEATTGFVVSAFRVHEADGSLIIQRPLPHSQIVEPGNWFELNPVICIKTAV